MYTSAYKFTLLGYQSCLKINASGDGHIDNDVIAPRIGRSGTNGLRIDDGLDSSSSGSKIYIGVSASALVYNKVSASQQWRKVLTQTDSRKTCGIQRIRDATKSKFGSRSGAPCHELEICIRLRPQMSPRLPIRPHSGVKSSIVRVRRWLKQLSGTSPITVRYSVFQPLIVVTVR